MLLLNGKSVFTIHGFTTEEKFLDYGDDNSIPLREVSSMEEHLIDYAETNGYMDFMELNDSVPPAMINYTDTYLSQSRFTGVNTLAYNDNCEGTGTGPLNGAFTGFSGFKWRINSPFNDNIEKFSAHIGNVGVLNRVYARRWFRTHMITTWTWYGNPRCFNGPLSGLANRASSWIAIN